MRCKKNYYRNSSHFDGALDQLQNDLNKLYIIYKYLLQLECIDILTIILYYRKQLILYHNHYNNYKLENYGEYYVMTIKGHSYIIDK